MPRLSSAFLRFRARLAHLFVAGVVLALPPFTGELGASGEVPLASDVSATGPSIITPAQAREHVGELVVVVAEIKGVSFSPRSGLTYLNFGDAYPRQTLSCKIPAELVPLRTKIHGSFGRMVRVVGRVEATATGPVITLLQPDQVEFVASPAGDVLHDVGEGAAYQWRVRSAIAAWFAAEDYPALEALAARWRGDRTRMTDGRWLLPEFYGLGQVSLADDEAYLALIAKLENWRRARPEALEPVVALANVHVRHAWFARGGGWADTVTAEGFRLMAERLARARTLLESLGPRFGECPHAAAVMQVVALGQGWPDVEYQELCAAALAREPEYLSYHHNIALRLLPRWYGRPGDWEAYARSGASDPFGRELQARIAWGLRRLHGNIFDESTLGWPAVREGFEELLRRYPDSVRNRSAYALFAGQAGDRDTCLRLLDELGDALDMELWINWENAELARRWIADPSRPPPVIFRVKRESESGPLSVEG